MRGHDALIALRMQGKAPAAGVLLEVCEGEPSAPTETAGAALVQVEAGDTVERLDLRCLVGLKVVAYGAAGYPSDERIRAVARRAASLAKRAVAIRGETVLFDSEDNA